KNAIRRLGSVAEVTGQAGFVGISLTRKSFQISRVDPIGRGIRGRQDDEGIALSKIADRTYTAVKKLQILRAGLALPYPVQHAHEICVILAEHVLELEVHCAGAVLQRGHVKEERSAETSFEVFRLGRFLNDGRELVKVAEQQEAHTAERLAGPS